MIGDVRFFYRTVRFAFWAYFTLFHRLKVYGAAHTSQEGGIIAPNHASFYDPPLIAASCPEEIHFLARKTLFRSLFGRLIACLNAHPITSNISSLSVIKEICALLTRGKKVVIFPEGARTETGEFLAIKSGVSLIAFRAHCHIIPAYIHGSYRVWKRSSSMPKMWGKMAVVYGSPIEIAAFEAMPKKVRQEALTEELERRMKALRTWYFAGCEGTPP